MERPAQDNSSKKYSVLKNIFNRDFVISAVIPIIIFTFLDNLGMTLDGIILSGGWSIGVICVNFIKERRISALASISAIVAVINRNHHFKKRSFLFNITNNTRYANCLYVIWIFIFGKTINSGNS